MITEYVYSAEETENIKCFLCNKTFDENNEILLLFEKQLTENGTESFSFADILSSISGNTLDENNTHSKLICQTCAQIIHEYELVEQHYFDLRNKILDTFNRTIKENNLSEINVNEIILNRNGNGDDHVDDDDLYNVVIEEDHCTDDIIEEIDCESIKDFHNKNEMKLSEEINKDIEVIDNREENVREEFTTDQLLTMLDNNETKLNNGNEKRLGDNIKSEEKIEEVDGHNEVEEMFITNEAQIIEIMSGDGVHYEQIIEENSNADDISLTKTEEEENDLLKTDVEKSVDVNTIKNTSPNSKNRKSCSIKTQKLITPTKPVYAINGDKIICLICNSTCQNENDIEEQQTQETEKSVEFDFCTISIHLRSVHMIRIYMCDVCGKEFQKRSEMNEHVDEEHGGTNDGEFRCETCNRVFTNLRLFRVHKRLHYSTPKQYGCVHCEKKYTSKNLLIEHMNMHTGQRPYKCNYCPKEFASKYTLTAHLKIHQTRPRPFVCKQCSKAFFSAQNLQQHEKTHLGVKEFVCEVCNKAFGTQHNLDVHKIVHTGLKPYVCRVCDKAFARRAEIKDHERVHTGEKPFSCDICNMSFAQRSNLTTHKRATHLNDKRYKCHLCDRLFKRRRLLDYHIRATHTGERPHKCDMCGASFVYPEHFKKHQRIHSGEKPYACEVCGKKFNSRDNRNAHRFVHSDKKPYECLTCGQGFMRKPLLYSHMQQAGHMNDTIVINQARITKDGTMKMDENLITQIDENQEDMIIEEHLIVDNNVVNMIGTETVTDQNSSDYDNIVPTRLFTPASNVPEVIIPDQDFLNDDDKIITSDGNSVQVIQVVSKYENSWAE